MDFHSLPRRDLQSLCKKNKIPANMTNVSMADALKALIHVEGLEDILNQTEFNPLQSPENPRTARRKPSHAESGSSKSLTSARRALRIKAAEEVKEENKNVNVPETPAAPTTRRRATVHSARRKVEIHLEEAEEGQEKRDVPETLVVPTSRRRAPATSSRRKVDGQEDEGSVQRVYSTRRSVRLLEKSMSGLSLKEQRRTEPIKMIEYVENEGKKETSESAQATDGLESSGQISDGLLEEDLNDSHDFSVVEEGSAVPEKISAEIMDLTDSQISPQHEKNDSKKGELHCDESKIVDCQQLASSNPDLEPKYATDEESKADESQEKPNDFHQDNGNGEEVKYESAKGSETLPEVSASCDVNDFPCDSTAEDCSGSGSSFEHIVDEVDEEESINAENVEKLSCLMENNTDESQEKPNDFHQENGNKDTSPVKYESAKGSETLPDVSASCDVNDFPDDSTAEDYSGSGSSFEHIADEIDEEESINADNVEKLSCLTENNTDGPDADVREELNFRSALSDKASEVVMQICPTYPLVSEGKAEDPIALPKMGEYDSRALIVDINVAQAEEFGKITHENLPSLGETPSRGTGIGQNAQFAPEEVPGQFPCPNLPSTEKQTTFPMMSQASAINKENSDMISCNLEIKKDEMREENNVIDKGHKIVAQFAPDSVPGQFPRPNFPSTEKRTTFPMMTQDSGINKENYDMISCDLEIKKDEMRKEKNVIDKGHKIVLEGESIRSLKKMLKRNLMINESTKDKDSNFTKEGNTRPALQKLPENCMPVADPVEM